MFKKVALMLALWCMVSVAALAQSGYTPGDAVEDFSATLSDGTVFTLSETLAEGKPVLLNFWASWCSPCRQEMPAMEAAWQQLKDDVAFVCLSIEETDTLETIASIREELGLATLPMGLGGANLYEKFENPTDSIPLSLVIDRNGVLCFSHDGSVTETERFLMEVIAAQGDSEPRLPEELPRTRTTVEPSSEEEPASSSLNPDGTANYTVLVTDKAGNGIERVMVQICTDALCQVFFTDANGVVTMTADPFAYQVHILRAQGFEAPEETYLLPELGGSLQIELNTL